MAIGNAAVVAARCDACPTVVYAEQPAQPKGFSGTAKQIDGNGREFNAPWFACQGQHVGKAVQNALKGAKPAAPTALPHEQPESYQKSDDSWS